MYILKAGCDSLLTDENDEKNFWHLACSWSPWKPAGSCICLFWQKIVCWSLICYKIGGKHYCLESTHLVGRILYLGLVLIDSHSVHEHLIITLPGKIILNNISNSGISGRQKFISLLFIAVIQHLLSSYVVKSFLCWPLIVFRLQLWLIAEFWTCVLQTPRGHSKINK